MGGRGRLQRGEPLLVHLNLSVCFEPGTCVQGLDSYFGTGTLGLSFGTDNLTNTTSLWSVEP